MNHIESFDRYLQALHEFLTATVYPKVQQPVVMLASSMGAHVAVRYLSAHPDHRVESMVVEAPMFDFKTPLPWTLAQYLTRFMCWLGYDKNYALGYGDFDPHKEKFEGNKTTSDPKRFERQRQLCISNPHLVSSGPSWGWARAAFDSTKTLKDPLTLSQVKVPVLVQVSLQDEIVDADVDKICQQLPKCTLRKYTHAKHHLLMERDEIRSLVIQDMIEFFRGSR
jgi:lysophospholipase